MTIMIKKNKCNANLTKVIITTLVVILNLNYEFAAILKLSSHNSFAHAFFVGPGRRQSASPFRYHHTRCSHSSSNETKIRKCRRHRSKGLFHPAAGGYVLFSSIGNNRPSAQIEEQANDASSEFLIREADYSDLSAVTKIIVDSFYKPSPLFRHYFFFKELDRLQSNFPYGDDRHTMYVACARDGDGSTVVGFVDVDFRPSQRKNAPPRPYLSDLAVDERFRRRGIAKRLVRACEEEMRSKGQVCLHLRVEFDNEAAMRMYHSLGYMMEPSDIFGVIDTTVLLKRNFDGDGSMNGGECKENNAQSVNVQYVNYR
mmetsp:Transcript_4137/g.5333  ORF Transcript_4137/g.5333 Transcript_4137/m.5333 type:complete len:314 (-) Transcript_4137:41-982(-)